MALTKFEDLTDTDRLNLCDIAWFIKGYRAAHKDGDCAIELCHEESLKNVINAIRNKVRNENISDTSE